MPTFPHGYAVVVGIADYHWSLGSLAGSVLNDARDIAGLLIHPERCGYPREQVRLLLDGEANRKGLLKAIDWLAEKAPPEATAILYFSGHGLRQETLKGWHSYLAAQDARLDGFKLAGVVKAEELTKRLKAIRAARLTVIFDCCHAAGAAELKGATAYRKRWSIKGGLDDPYLASLGHGEGRVVLASCTSEETSLVEKGCSNSLFTLHLLEALAGAGTAEDQGEVRILDVFQYLSNVIPAASANRQHPVLKLEVRTNFVLAMRAPLPPKTRTDEQPRTAQALTAKVVAEQAWVSDGPMTFEGDFTFNRQGR